MCSHAIERLDCFIAKTKETPKVGSVSSEEELHGENSKSDSGRLEEQQFHLQKRSQKV